MNTFEVLNLLRLYVSYGQWEPLPKFEILELLLPTLWQQDHIAGIRGVVITPRMLYQWPPNFGVGISHLENLVKILRPDTYLPQWALTFMPD